MDVGEPRPGTSVVDELSEATLEESGTSLQIVVDELMPEKKKNFTPDEEFESCLAYLRDIVEELESSNFTNIREILRMNPTMEVERAVGTMVALAGSTKLEWEMPSNCRKFYRERKK